MLRLVRDEPTEWIDMQDQDAPSDAEGAENDETSAEARHEVSESEAAEARDGAVDESDEGAAERRGGADLEADAERAVDGRGEEIRDIGACDQQHERYAAEEKQQSGADLADVVCLQREYREAEPRHIRSPCQRIDLPGDGIPFRLGLCGSAAIA